MAIHDIAQRGLRVEQGFQVEVRGDHIVVTFVGTSFCVSYPKPKRWQALLPTGFSKAAQATSAQVVGFLSVAQTLAKEKAKKLGWIE
jgi:hypothetical protein